MRQPQLVTYGIDGRLAEQLRALATAHGLWLRDVQHPGPCLNLLRQGGPAVLVLRLGRDLPAELDLLRTVHHLLPDTAAVVVGDTDSPALAGLAWDLGARFVLFPPHPVETLPDLVRSLLPEAKG